MRLDIIGSSSSGNCYVLHNNDEALIIEMGCKFQDVLKVLNFRRSIIKGAIVSHSHVDHSKDWASLQKWDIPYAAPADVSGTHIVLGNKGWIHFGNFGIDYFKVEHNADCRGFLIKHPDIGKLLFVTDAKLLPYRFKNLTHVMIEANYSEEMWIEYPERRHGNTNHMEINDTESALVAQDLSKCNDIILLHLSDGLSNAEEFRRQIEGATGIPTTVADKGMSIEW